ncbi:MAG: hypothetical protein AAF628_04615 [Planctomycetota bacterium]
MTSRDTEGRVAHALRALLSMHHDGTLPPILEPLLAITPGGGMDVEVHMDEPLDEGPHGARRWHAHGGQVTLSYYPSRERRDEDVDPFGDLVQVVLEAERNPQLNFVALKFLRDRLLPQSRLTWTRSPQTCQRVIADAIEQGILSTCKKPNPRNPEFPVTAVELNRDHGAVRDRMEGDAAAEIAEVPLREAASGEAETR